MMDILNTKDMLRRRHYNFEGNQFCVLCQDSEEETLNHLFFDCQFSQACWNIIGIDWDNSMDAKLKVDRTRSIFNYMFYIEIFYCSLAYFETMEWQGG